MSYDIILTGKPCETCGRSNDYERQEWNYTYNIFPMQEKAGIFINNWHQKPVTEVLPQVDQLIAAMKADPEGYTALNPTNGWGSYETFLKVLREIADGMRDCPDGYVRIS